MLVTCCCDFVLTRASNFSQERPFSYCTFTICFKSIHHLKAKHFIFHMSFFYHIQYLYVIFLICRDCTWAGIPSCLLGGPWIRGLVTGVSTLKMFWQAVWSGNLLQLISSWICFIFGGILWVSKEFFVFSVSAVNRQMWSWLRVSAKQPICSSGVVGQSMHLRLATGW